VIDSVGLSQFEQKPDGSWLFSDTDPEQYTWCHANCIIALSEFRGWLAGPAGRVALIRVLLASVKVSDIAQLAPILINFQQLTQRLDVIETSVSQQSAATVAQLEAEASRQRSALQRVFVVTLAACATSLSIVLYLLGEKGILTSALAWVQAWLSEEAKTKQDNLIIEIVATVLIATFVIFRPAWLRALIKRVRDNFFRP
jgi:hypothetical protein